MLKTGSILGGLLAAVVALPAAAAAAGCQKGIASAPYIGAVDMRAIDRAAVHLPAERPGKLHLSIGAAVPRGLARKPLPAAVSKVLPQYKSGGYTALRGRRTAGHRRSPRPAGVHPPHGSSGQTGKLPLRTPLTRSVESPSNSA